MPLPHPEPMFSQLARKIRSFRRRPYFEKAWFLPTWMLLGICRLGILAIPFRHLAPSLGRHAGTAPWTPLLDSKNEARALSIARVVKLAGRYTPWVSNCLNEAMTARILLGLWGIPYCFLFGVRKEGANSPLEAHAWVIAGKVRVTGGVSFNRYQVVGCFVSSH